MSRGRRRSPSMITVWRRRAAWASFYVCQPRRVAKQVRVLGHRSVAGRVRTAGLEPASRACTSTAPTGSSSGAAGAVSGPVTSTASKPASHRTSHPTSTRRSGSASLKGHCQAADRFARAISNQSSARSGGIANQRYRKGCLVRRSSKSQADTRRADLSPEPAAGTFTSVVDISDRDLGIRPIIVGTSSDNSDHSSAFRTDGASGNRSGCASRWRAEGLGADRG